MNTAQGQHATPFTHTPNAILPQKRTLAHWAPCGQSKLPERHATYIFLICLDVLKWDSYGINPNPSFPFLGNSCRWLRPVKQDQGSPAHPHHLQNDVFLKAFVSVHHSLPLKSPFYYFVWFKKYNKPKFPPKFLELDNFQILTPYDSLEGCPKFPMSARNTNQPFNRWVIYDTVKKSMIGLHQRSLYHNCKSADKILLHIHPVLTMCYQYDQYFTSIFLFGEKHKMCFPLLA